MKGADVITNLLDAARRHWTRVRSLKGIAWIAAVISISIGLITILFGAFPEGGPPGWVAAVLKIISIMAFTAALGYLVVALRSPGRRKMALAVEQALGGLNNDLIISLELVEAKALGRNIYSDALAQAYVASAADRIASLDVSPVMPSTWMKRSMVAAIVAVVAAAIIAVKMPGAFKSAALYLIAPRISPDEAIAKQRIERQLVLGDIELSYEFPAYTGKKPVVQTGTDGSIEALKGTVAHLKARSLQSITEANVRIGDTKSPAKITGANNIETTITVIRTDSYKMVAVGKDGEDYIESVSHPIKVIPDTYPQIDLVEPKGDMEVEDAGVLPLKFFAEDDFGIKDVDVVYMLRGKEGRITAVAPEKGTREVSGTYNWDMAALGLQPGDRVKYYLEVSDNDEVSGPKKTASRALTLEIYSPRKEHRKTVDRQWELLRDLIGLLGDELEHDPKAGGKLKPEEIENAKRIGVKMKGTVAAMNDLLAAMKKDRYADLGSYTIIENVRNDIKAISARRSKQISSGSFAADVLAALKNQETPVVEKSVLALDDALGRQKAVDVFSNGKDLLDAQRSISDLLAKAQAGDKEALMKLEGELERMQEAMAEMMKNMSRGARTLPEDFMNTDAMKNMQLDKTMDFMQALRNAIKDGDIKSALEMARQLQDSMAKMMAAMEGGMKNFGNMTMGREMAELNDISDRVQELRDEQNRIYKESQQVGVKKQESLLNEQQNQMGKTLEKIKKLVRDINGMVKSSHEDSKRLQATKNLQNLNNFYNAVNTLNNFLLQLQANADYPFKLIDDRDLFGLKMEMLRWKGLIDQISNYAGIIDSMGKFENDSGRKLRQKAELMKKDIEEILKILDQIAQSPQRNFSGEDQARLKSLAQEQSKLEEEANKLKRRMESLREKLPMLGAEPPQQMGEASAAMNKAHKKLGASDPDGALPPEAEALKKLDQAAKNLQGLQQQLRNSASGGMGMPMPMPMPMGMMPQSGMREGGYQMPGMFEPGDVPIPGRTGYKVPEQFREDILRAMRNKSPELYRDLNRDYYRKLIE